jgi:ABC-type branched-subunit amino acid transport system permease subunit
VTPPRAAYLVDGVRTPVGSLGGAFLGSIVIGFIYTFGQALLPDLAYVILFLPMVIVLAARPRGRQPQRRAHGCFSPGFPRRCPARR